MEVDGGGRLLRDSTRLALGMAALLGLAPRTQGEGH